MKKQRNNDNEISIDTVKSPNQIIRHKTIHYTATHNTRHEVVIIEADELLKATTLRVLASLGSLEFPFP